MNDSRYDDSKSVNIVRLRRVSCILYSQEDSESLHMISVAKATDLLREGKYEVKYLQHNDEDRIALVEKVE